MTERANPGPAPARLRNLHALSLPDRPVIFDAQRVRLYDGSEVEAALLAGADPDADPDEVARAEARLDRLARLSDTLGAAAAAERDAPEFATLWLNLTHACNLDCRYCYARDGGYADGAATMTAAMARQAVDLLAALPHPSGVAMILFAGGEPLLNVDALRAAVLHAEARAGRDLLLVFRVLTNGTILDDTILALLQEHRISLQISVDGPAEVHDRNRRSRNGRSSFAQVQRNLARLREGGIEVSLRSTLCSASPGADELAEGLEREGLSGVRLQPVMCGSHNPLRLSPEQVADLGAHYGRLAHEAAAAAPSRRAPPVDLAPFVERLREGAKTRRYCGAGHSMVVVSPDGTLHPCPSLVSANGFGCGSLTEGLDTGAIAPFAHATVDDKPTCRACWARNLCGGGCVAQAHEVNGSLHEPDPGECAVIRAKIRAAIQYYDLAERRTTNVRAPRTATQEGG